MKGGFVFFDELGLEFIHVLNSRKVLSSRIESLILDQLRMILNAILLSLVTRKRWERSDQSKICSIRV